MQHYIHSKHNNKGRITIGLIPENSANEDENRMRIGVVEAAKKHNVNLICFTHLEAITKNSVSYGYEAEQFQHSHEILQQLIEEFEIDGLLFLGWSVLFDGENLEKFKKRFSHIPLLSLGRILPDIPSVFFDGREYVQEMLLHLIHKHQYRKIAFIESWREDDRKFSYLQTMKKYGLYDPKLFVSAADLDGVMLSERPQRALSLLLDERKVEFDAIVVMRSEESRIMLEQLKLRGMSVPYDVALTSYEDDISIQYSYPPITTVYFPFQEMGYAGCEKMIELLTEGTIPLTTAVPGHILFRHSCGCMQEEDWSRSWSEAPEHEIDLDVISREMYHLDLDFQELDHSFKRSMENDSFEFITTLENQMKERSSGINSYQRLISLYRSYYPLYLQMNVNEMAKAENLWHLARVAISESEKAWLVNEMITKRNRELTLEEFGQSLLNAFEMSKIFNVLEFNLSLLGIHSCNIFLSGETQRRFEDCTHIYGYSENNRYTMQESMNTKGYNRQLIQENHTGTILIVSLLHVELNYFGYICFEPGPLEGTLYLRLAIQLSNALISSLTVDKLKREIILRKEKEKQLSYYAHYDTVTGLLNRRSLYEGISQLEERKKFFIFFLDVDGFKSVNDSLGHDAGDQLLIEISNRIKGVLKEQVVKFPNYRVLDADESEHGAWGICRLGGDEFIAIIDKTGIEDVAELANQLIEQIRMPYTIKDVKVLISCSLGISCYPTDGLDRKLLIQYADIAMYRSKRAGGNHYQLFNALMMQESLSKLELSNHLRQALDNDELTLNYQPQMDCIEGKIIGVEALLRWNHPTMGPIPPSTFIPIAEETGLIISIGEWVLRKACEQMMLWQKAKLPAMTLAVNLSANQFLDGKLVEKVSAILEETGLEAQYLEFEITENVAMKEDQIILLHELRNLGVSISVDDFGTQYSSLSYLKRLPVTKLKLDQSFVRGIQSDSKDREMIKAIIFVAKSFELEVIAEGVETLEEVNYLIDHGCSLIQGYYFYKPMPPEKISQVVLEH